MIDHELAGTGKHIDVAQLALQPEFPERELVRGPFRQTLMAARGAGAVAQGPVGAANHVAVGGADRGEFVKCEDDAAGGQNGSRRADQVGANRLEVMKVHDIWVERAQELREGFGQRGVVVTVEPGIVIGPVQQIDVVLPVEAGDSGAGTVGIARVRVHRRQHMAFDIVAGAQFLEQFLTDDGRAAGDEIGVAETDQKDPGARFHTTPTGLESARLARMDSCHWRWNSQSLRIAPPLDASGRWGPRRSKCHMGRG